MTRSSFIHPVYEFTVRYVLLDPLGLVVAAWTDILTAETPEEIIEQHKKTGRRPHIERIELNGSVVYDRMQNAISYNLAESMPVQ